MGCLGLRECEGGVSLALSIYLGWTFYIYTHTYRVDGFGIRTLFSLVPCLLAFEMGMVYIHVLIL